MEQDNLLFGHFKKEDIKKIEKLGKMWKVI